MLCYGWVSKWVHIILLSCQVVGLGVSGWFVYRYLGTADDRWVWHSDSAEVLLEQSRVPACRLTCGGQDVHHAAVAKACALHPAATFAPYRKDLKREFDSFLQKVGVKK